MDSEKKPKEQIQPVLKHFTWPTSKPGPRATQPPPGQKKMPGRTDQAVEMSYSQQKG